MDTKSGSGKIKSNQIAGLDVGVSFEYVEAVLRRVCSIHLRLTYICHGLLMCLYEVTQWVGVNRLHLLLANITQETRKRTLLLNFALEHACHFSFFPPALNSDLSQAVSNTISNLPHCKKNKT